MTPPKGVCVACDGEVSGDHHAVREVHGYAQERAAGGYHSILHPTRLDGRIWHSHCFEGWWRRQQGHGEQSTLAL